MVPVKISTGSRPLSTSLGDRTKLDAGRGRQAQVEDDEIDDRHVTAEPRQQLRPALHDHGGVAGALERGAETVADKRGVVGDDHRHHGNGGFGHLKHYRTFDEPIPGSRVAVVRAMSL
jgi:hypothetical protein